MDTSLICIAEAENSYTGPTGPFPIPPRRDPGNKKKPSLVKIEDNGPSSYSFSESVSAHRTEQATQSETQSSNMTSDASLRADLVPFQGIIQTMDLANLDFICGRLAEKHGAMYPSLRAEIEFEKRLWTLVGIERFMGRSRLPTMNSSQRRILCLYGNAGT